MEVGRGPEQLPEKPIEERVREEIAQEKVKGPNWGHRYFNNFRMNLPVAETGFNYSVLRSYPEHLLSGETNRSKVKSEKNATQHSNLYLDQTPNEYFRAIDEVIEEQERKNPQVPLREKIIAIQTGITEADKVHDNVKAIKLIDELSEVTTDVYIDLLKKGYTEFDLRH